MFIIMNITVFANYSIDWVRVADSYLKNGAMIARDADDNVAGTGSDQQNIYTQYYDKFGNLLWQRSSSSGIHSNYEASTWVNIDAQKNVYVTGYRYTISTQPPYRYPNAMIVLKYDAAGNLLWKYILPGSYGITLPYSSSRFIFRSELDAQGNLYMCTSGNISGNPVSGFILVKINPQGNTVWARTHNFGTAQSYWSMRMKNNLIVLTGSSALYNHNVSSVMYDTAGNEKWAATTSEYGGAQDVELDNAGNAYILCWNYNEVSTGSGADIVVLKYNSSGTQTNRFKYDLGGDEYPSKLTITGTDQLGIIGSTLATGSYHLDWQIEKINMNGTLLWSKKTESQGLYDVYPNAVTGNSKGDLFVSGSTNNGKGYIAMGTAKYLSDGTLSWNAVYDSTASSGIALRLASDGSIYALGYSIQTLIHYFDFTGTGNCNYPDTAAAVNIKRTSAVIVFRKNPSAFVYHIQYKPVTSPVWTTISTDKTIYTLTNLTPGTTYQYRIEAVCSSGPSDYGAIREFTTKGMGYCKTGGINSSGDWIDLVWLGSIQNGTQNNNGYADFTYISGNITQGASVSGYLSSSNGGSVTEYFRVWIDFNIDGDFNDAGELVIDTSSNSIGWISVKYTVPPSAKNGAARMRVSMRNGAPPLSCGSYPKGETEDYTVVIIPPVSAMAATATANQIIKLSTPLMIAPNPAKNIVYINHPFTNNKAVTVTITNAGGQKVLSAILTGNMLNVGSLANGMYMMQVIQDGKIINARFLIQR